MPKCSNYFERNIIANGWFIHDMYQLKYLSRNLKNPNSWLDLKPYKSSSKLSTMLHKYFSFISCFIKISPQPPWPAGFLTFWQNYFNFTTNMNLASSIQNLINWSASGVGTFFMSTIIHKFLVLVGLLKPSY